MARIAVLGALDTKGAEIQFLKHQIEACGHETLVVDLGILGPAPFPPQVRREEVASAAGEEITALAAAGDRGRAVAAMTRGVEKVIARLHGRGLIDAVIGLGGSAGTVMACAAMRALPLGVPKLMISTVAAGDVKPFLGVKDIVMFPAIVDISGLNRISRTVLAQAAAAISAMASASVPESEDRPIVFASMFGNTTPCVEAARKILEAAGYEVLVFHATGTGGRIMESLIEAGYAAGVLDVTTTEWADQLVGGVMAAGETRLEAAARSAIPAVIVPGCLDMVNFWAPETIPEKFRDRLFYRHNPNVTLMRTTPQENARLGKILAEKINLYRGPVAVYLPLRGISVISAPGEPFHSPEADRALFESIKENLKPGVSVCELDANINDPHFAEAITTRMLEMLASARQITGRAG